MQQNKILTVIFLSRANMNVFIKYLKRKVFLKLPPHDNLLPNY